SAVATQVATRWDRGVWLSPGGAVSPWRDVGVGSWPCPGAPRASSAYLPMGWHCSWLASREQLQGFFVTCQAHVEVLGEQVSHHADVLRRALLAHGLNGLYAMFGEVIGECREKFLTQLVL